MRIAVLCSARFGLPIVALLAQRGQLAGIGMPAAQSHAGEALAPMAAHLGVPLQRIAAADLPTLPDWLATVRADVLLVTGFPHRLPDAVLDRPPLGAYNVHPSPLPRYRGPDPLFWQLYHGESRTVLTVHRMTSAFDAGPIVHTTPVALQPHDTYGLAEARLMDAAPNALQGLLALLDQHGADVPGTLQAEAAATAHPRPDASHLMIDWSRPAEAIHAQVRAANPRTGGAGTYLRGHPVRVHQVTPVKGNGAPGTVVRATMDELRVAAGTQAVRLDVVASDEGVFTGNRFAAALGLCPGDACGLPFMPPMPAPH